MNPIILLYILRKKILEFKVRKYTAEYLPKYLDIDIIDFFSISLKGVTGKER